MASKIEVDPESGCWLWTGSRNREGLSGCGTVSYQGKTDLVHRVVFRLLVGEIPEGFQVSHAEPRWPHHTRCCNPDHLEAVTRQEALGRRDGVRARARRTHSGNAGPVAAGGARAVRLRTGHVRSRER
ncbi:HNH endonuclease signature motif containing protein [Streptomyces lomondensis]